MDKIANTNEKCCVNLAELFYCLPNMAYQPDIRVADIVLYGGKFTNLPTSNRNNPINSVINNLKKLAIKVQNNQILTINNHYKGYTASIHYKQFWEPNNTPGLEDTKPPIFKTFIYLILEYYSDTRTNFVYRQYKIEITESKQTFRWQEYNGMYK